MEIIAAVLVTVLAGFAGEGLLGDMLNWPGAGSVVAVAVMGAFILYALRRSRNREG